MREALFAQSREKKLGPYAESLLCLPENIRGIRGIISQIRVFPIKALGALHVESARVTEHGLIAPGWFRDRSAMIARKNLSREKESDPEYMRFSQREQPELALIRPHMEGDTLVYTADHMTDIRLEAEDLYMRTGKTVSVEVVEGTIIPAVREDGDITRQIRQFLGQFRQGAADIDVLLPSIDHERIVEERHRCRQQAETLFSDGGQLLLASASTLGFVNEEARQRWKGIRWQGEVSMDAMRPNLTVSAWPANLEDIVGSAVIQPMQGGVQDKVRMLFGDLCIRCSVTAVDTQTGKRRTDGEPLGTLSAVRPRRLDGGNKTTFGINTVFPKESWDRMIRQWSTIEVTEEKHLRQS